MGIHKAKKRKLYIKEVTFVAFSRTVKHNMSTKYKNLVIPTMKVMEVQGSGKKHLKEYECLLQDTDHHSAGNRINKRLQKGDKVYKITNEEQEVLYLIGCGKKHRNKHRQSKDNSVGAALLKAFIGCGIMAILILGIQFLLSGGYYLFGCIFIYKRFVDFNYTGWITILGWVKHFNEFIFIGLLLPALWLVLVLILMPFLGTHIVDILGFSRITNIIRKK